MIPYPDEFFPDSAIFAPAAPGQEARGDVAIAPGQGVRLSCYVERPTDLSVVSDQHHTREVRTDWHVFTPTDSSAALDSYVFFDGMVLKVKTRSRLSGVAWWTECVRVG